MLRRIFVGLGCLGLIAGAALAFAVLTGGEPAPSAAAQPLLPLPAALREPTAAPAATSSPAPSPTTTPAATFTATPRPAPGLLVANTRGQGAYLRRTPGEGERLRSWPEGAAMLPSGAQQTVEGELWLGVRDSAGNEGWMLASLLAPAPAATPAAVAATPTAMPAPTVPAPSPTPRAAFSGRGLELLAAEGYRQGGLIVVEGRVANVGDAEGSSLWATVDLFDAAGVWVKSQAAPLLRQTLSPSQTSTFKVTAVDDVAVVFYTVAFRDLRGAALPLLDPR
ncbi:MAG: FxLYD domain-containing protein [Chloroflexota bacterium]